MSSCFSVDVSHEFVSNECKRCYFTSSIVYLMYRAHKPVIAGSGAYQSSTMHSGVGNVNYVSYFVRRIQFSATYSYSSSTDTDSNRPGYAVLFKIPYREPLLDDFFLNIKDFILYSEPECVLGYGFTATKGKIFVESNCSLNRFEFTVTKPFIVGPNDYVGVFYFIPSMSIANSAKLILQGTAKVWFDPV